MPRRLLITVLVIAAAGISAAAALAATSRSSTPVPRGTITVHHLYPAAGKTVAGDADFTVQFSAPIASGQTSAPQLSPKLAGRWKQTGPRTLRFFATGAYAPGTKVTLTVPRGVRSSTGAVLKKPTTDRFTIAQPSNTRMLQLLAVLRYLPVHFVSSDSPPQRSADAQMKALYSPPTGKYEFGKGWPSGLQSLWSSDQSTVERGAIMAFQSQHGMSMSGTAGSDLWTAMLTAVEKGQYNTAGYTYAVASESSPESLTVYHNGAVVLKTPANTGISDAPTATGTYAVYSRLRSQTMTGTNPDGSSYSDFVQYVAYFNGGDAVHYMPRASYGSPQSVGCVELPYSAAAKAWGYLSYGSLVTVAG